MTHLKKVSLKSILKEGESLSSEKIIFTEEFSNFIIDCQKEQERVLQSKIVTKEDLNLVVNI